MFCFYQRTVRHFSIINPYLDYDLQIHNIKYNFRSCHLRILNYPCSLYHTKGKIKDIYIYFILILKGLRQLKININMKLFNQNRDRQRRIIKGFLHLYVVECIVSLPSIYFIGHEFFYFYHIKISFLFSLSFIYGTVYYICMTS